jgi:3-oxoacid CoA-transferase subunit A
MSSTKVFNSFSEAVADIPDGAIIMVGGFTGLGGIPQNLILAIRDLGVKNLTQISNSTWGSGKARNFIDTSIWVENKQLKKAIVSVMSDPNPIGSKAFEEQYYAGEVELELVPQGTLAERIRAGGFGIGGFYTRTGVGTPVEEGKEKKVLNGDEYILELPLKADYALVRAYKADTMGNLVYRGTGRNFNPVMAPAARITIAEVDEIVEPGEIDPEIIVTPGLFVNRIVKIPAGSS